MKRSPSPTADDFVPVTDDAACALVSEAPRCLFCNEIARPNILMFSDCSWQSQRSRKQALRFTDWIHQAERLVTIEIGAGTEIPTIRSIGERQEGTLIRINPRDTQIPKNGIAIPLAGC